jgi:hypothetical protein
MPARGSRPIARGMCQAATAAGVPRIERFGPRARSNGSPRLDPHARAGGFGESFDALRITALHLDAGGAILDGMRTTVDLDPGLLETAKRLASKEHRTLSAVLGDALAAYLGIRRQASKDPPFELPRNAVTVDGDFARFAGLRYRHPLA